MLKNLLLFFGCLFILGSGLSQATSPTPNQSRARDIFKELVEINTTASVGNTTIAAKAMEKRLIAAGFAQKDVQVLGPAARNQSLVVRLHGTGKYRPVLLLAHLDVVEAKREDWTFDPFVLREEGGYFTGRGTADIKDGAAILVADFIRLKQEGFTPDRDLIMALTAGEETETAGNGVEWLIEHQRPLIDAEYCINMDAGAPRLKNGKLISRGFATAEKGYLDLKLVAKSAGGHSSVPSKDNAIYHLAKALLNLSNYDFPVSFNPATKSFFHSMSAIETGALAADMKAVSGDLPDSGSVRRLSAIPVYNAMLRTTCVATMLEGGHAPNALPQTAAATVNCRVMPGGTQADIVRQIVTVLADSQVVVTVMDSLKTNPPSELNPGLFAIVEQVTAKFWPGVPVIAVMPPGTTDGMYLRGANIPTYGISGVPLDGEDAHAHGLNERIPVKSFYEGLEYEYTLIKAISTQ